jgi:putative ABC transport system substrate-binding protein
VLYTLVPDGSAGEPAWGAPRPQDGVVYLDQPLDRQLRLALQVKPGAARVGVLFGPAQQVMERQLRAAAASLGLSVVVGLVEDDSGVGPAIEYVLQSSDLLLALPNPDIFNRKTLFNILLSSYHSRVPMIGFSAAYVKSGALAAVFTSPDDMGRDVAETVVDHLLSGRKALPPPRHPARFTVAINPQVARSLDITLPDAGELERLLREAER